MKSIYAFAFSEVVIVVSLLSEFEGDIRLFGLIAGGILAILTSIKIVLEIREKLKK